MLFTVICPIHNEASFLPLILPSIYRLKPAEAIFCLDRCMDGSEQIIRMWGNHHRGETDTDIRYYDERHGQGWRFRGAYLRRDAYVHAHNDLILNTSADITLDQTIKKHLGKVRGATIFGFLDHPWTPQCFLRRLAGSVGLHGYSGLMAFSREAWFDTENQEAVKRIPRAEDTHLLKAIETQHPVDYVNTRSFHLRPNESPMDHYNRGVEMRRRKASLSEATASSALMLRPTQLRGFLASK